MATKRHPDVGLDDLESEFDAESDVERQKKRKPDALFAKERPPGEEQAPSRSEAKNVFDREHGKVETRKHRLLAMDAYSRHKDLINQYYLYYPGATKRLQRDTSRDKTDLDVIRENHKFVWSADEEPISWEQKLAKKYYDKLFKEYCLVDLSRYKENKFAMRWRVEKEVVSGKGQFVCGHKTCANNRSLTSWEVNFAYLESGVKKNTLVKLRLCDQCSAKLNYHQMKRKAQKSRRSKKEPPTLEWAEVKSEAQPDTSAGKTSVDSNDGGTVANKDDDATSAVQMTEAQAKEMWTKPPVEQEEEKSRDDEFEDFLEDMLL